MELRVVGFQTASRSSWGKPLYAHFTCNHCARDDEYRKRALKRRQLTSKFQAGLAGHSRCVISCGCTLEFFAGSLLGTAARQVGRTASAVLGDCRLKSPAYQAAISDFDKITKAAALEGIAETDARIWLSPGIEKLGSSSNAGLANK